MRAVNLIPSNRSTRSRRELPHASLGSLTSVGRKRRVLAATAVVVAAAGGVVVDAHFAASTVSARQQTLRNLDAQVAKLAKAAALPRASTGRLGIVESVAAQRTSWDGFLGALSRVIPENVWLVNLSASVSPAATSTTGTPPPSTTTPPAATPSAPTGFTITGYTYSQPSVGRLMRRLQLVPWLNDISLTTSAKTNLNNHLVYQFTLGANVISLPEVGS
jgi:Tfp pilus assembly protein PilN